MPVASVANQGQPILSRAREGHCGTCQSEATEAETRVVAAFKFGHAPLNLWSSFQITRLADFPGPGHSVAVHATLFLISARRQQT